MVRDEGKKLLEVMFIEVYFTYNTSLPPILSGQFYKYDRQVVTTTIRLRMFPPPQEVPAWLFAVRPPPCPDPPRLYFFFSVL